MPKFGNEQVAHLPELFEQVDELKPVELLSNYVGVLMLPTPKTGKFISINQDELENIDLESLNFIVGILNELNTINLRNEILLSVLPLKV